MNNTTMTMNKIEKKIVELKGESFSPFNKFIFPQDCVGGKSIVPGKCIVDALSIGGIEIDTIVVTYFDSVDKSGRRNDLEMRSFDVWPGEAMCLTFNGPTQFPYVRPLNLPNSMPERASLFMGFKGSMKTTSAESVGGDYSESGEGFIFAWTKSETGKLRPAKFWLDATACNKAELENIFRRFKQPGFPDWYTEDNLYPEEELATAN